MRAGVRSALALCGLVVLALAGCARPLTPNERAFASDVIGPSLDLDKVRVTRDLGLRPLPPKGSQAPRLLPVDAPPLKGFCDRLEPQSQAGPPPAFALYDRVHVADEFYRPDLAPGWPRAALLPEALILAHELVHVWQWQNRARTGYSPARAAFEGFARFDPYFYVPRGRSPFEGFGYEQQAALLEDYVCYALYDPGNPRRADLRAILGGHFPLGRLDSAVGQ
ncbi:hypothetical protein D6850_11125 [Roseovarius spongiae]|uniref:DUF4157 domain-containing protein n=1 Tax=Roseovarius spongiae TaxID=2320272 RepID=A0A3A8AX41_9RHOB|nr:hypothetical protein [Roseovarius spongiae]RKF15360.1 hypothetical protein D6850_11125 [Roseovarius spongiae]